MKPHEVAQLEADCEDALRSVVDDQIKNVSPHTLHMMAKAAVAVLEAVTQNTDK